jgi:hypothetical protein
MEEAKSGTADEGTPGRDGSTSGPDGNTWAFKSADSSLHTGAEGAADGSVSPEDLVLLSGREPTPERIEKARRALEEHGAAAVERYLP